MGSIETGELNQRSAALFLSGVFRRAGSTVVHSDTLPNGEVKVYIEKPDARNGVHHAACFLLAYRWEDIQGFTPEEISRHQEVIESTAHLSLEFARQGGFDNASSF